MSAADVLILILDDERYFDDLFIVATVATTVYDCSKSPAQLRVRAVLA
jgi:hypothetical protein